MADVFGTIGNEQVELQNAATEATLRLLLQATLSANRQSLAAVQQLATASGINPASAQAAANQAVTTSTRQFSSGLGAIIYPTNFEDDMKKVMDFYRHIQGHTPKNFFLDHRFS